MQQPPVAQALDAQQIPYRLFEHAGPVPSLEQAAAARGQTPAQVVRSLLFRLAGAGDDDRSESDEEAGQYVMVLVAGPAQIAWPALRRALGVSRVTMATRDQVRQVTGYEIGAVAPFGLPQPLPVLVEESVLAQSELSLGSGVRGIAIIIQQTDLLRALGDVPIVRLRQTVGE